jgi:glycosyltransferase involved in cell wall biosynthesis
MRVLFLNNYFYLRGGSERVLFEEMRMLKEAGHEIAVYSRANRQNEASEYDRYFPSDIDTEKAKISLRTLRTVKELIYSTSAKEGIKKLVEQFKPDVAHAHNIYGRLSLSVLDGLKEKQVPTVLTLHDYKLLCPSYLMLNHGEICERCKGKKFRNAFYTKCHKNSYAASATYAFESWFDHRFGKYDSVRTFISPSRFLREKAIDFGWDADRIEFLPNFIHTKEIPISNTPGTYLLYLGRLSPEKGITTLLKAFTILYPPQISPKVDNMNISLMIVGNGPLRRELEGAFARNDGRIRFGGYLSGKLLQDAIASARAVVMPSDCYENAPLSLIEAFAYGKPVIGARIGGIPEMIDDGVNGLLFEPGNMEDLKDKLALAMNLSDVKIRKMGKAAREKVESEYSAELHYERLVALYQGAIGKA